jgi:hypothetical protein
MAKGNLVGNSGLSVQIGEGEVMPLDWSKHKQLLEKLQEAVRKVGRSAVVARQGDSEPRNNDGRRHCWWCWSWTEKRQGFTAEYDICPKCEK